MIKKTRKRRVVVTGLGVVSSIGIGWQEFWKNCLAGKSGITNVTQIDTSKYECKRGGEIKGFNPDQFIRPSFSSAIGRSSQFAITAILLALEDARLKQNHLKGKNIVLSIGTTMGESQIIERFIKIRHEQENAAVHNNLPLHYPAHAIPTNIANYFGFKGKNLIFSNACAAGNYAIGQAFDYIASGKADFGIAGGVDALSRIAFTGFSRLFAMAPEKCQPFDKNRKGMMLGEGAGILCLESLEAAEARGASIYAEIGGYGLSCDSQHMTIPKQSGISKAIRKAVANAGIEFSDVGYISAHGTGTRENDVAESQAIASVFGSRILDVPISSIKSMLGHTMGAAAAIESIVCCLAIQKGAIPPTINNVEADPDCPIDCVPNKSRKARVKVALNNSQAFGGNNACISFVSLNGMH